MNPWMKRTAVSLSLLTVLAAPALASEPAIVTDARLISAPADSPAFTDVHLISAPADAPAITDVHLISAPVDLTLPAVVTVNGKPVTFDQKPVLLDGGLMVPVRAVAEAAGGEVTWDEGIQLVHIRMPDRTIIIRLGNAKAEMHEDGVNYFDRNLIAMEKAPVIMGARTLVSADALSTIFGFQIGAAQDGTLALASPVKEAPVTPAPDFGSEQGAITQAEAGRFLLSGAAMANGEARLTWVSVSDQTKILIREGDQVRTGSPADLQVGARVEVKYAGPLMMSYPARGAAAEITVLK